MRDKVAKSADWLRVAVLTLRRSEWQLGCLVVLFVIGNTVALALAREGALTWSHFNGVLAWLAASGVATLLIIWRRPIRDPLLMPIIFMLTGWGLVLQDRLAPVYFPRHVIWVVLGSFVFAAAAIAPRDLDNLRRYRYTWLVFGLLLLGATFVFGVNPSGYGPQLWLPLPLPWDVYFQPSELLKILLLIFLASYFESAATLLPPRRSPKSARYAFPFLGPLLLMWGFCMLLLVLQQDLGGAALFLLIFLTLLYLATGSRLYVISGLILLFLAGFIGYQLFSVVQLRIDAWWNPWPEAAGNAYQIVQSLYAVAAGGVTGQGVYQGFPEYVPVVHSDFVFAAAGEEWGLVGTMTLLGLFALLTYCGLRIAMVATRPFYKYLSAGIVIAFGIQTLLITGGVTKLLPLTGVTLPFVSYGGSSLIISCCMAGLLLFLSGESQHQVM